MKSCRINVLLFLCLMCVAVKQSIGARILEDGLFISPDNPSPFNSQLSSLMRAASSTPFPYPAEKSVIPCEEGGIKSWNGPHSHYKEQNNELTFAFKESGTPSGPISSANEILKGERLFTSSSHRPDQVAVGIGKIENYKEEKSGESGGVQQEGVGEKRILGSTPSPGGGH